MSADQDHVRRLIALVEAASDSVEFLSDDEVRSELSDDGARLDPPAQTIIAAQLARVSPEALIPAGMQVRLKTDPTRGGVVQPGEKVQAGRKMLPVQFLDGAVKWLPESALEVVPPVAPPLVDRFFDGRFASPEWLRRTFARNRVTGRLSDVVYSMEATETDFYAYQFKPVLKLLNSPTDALLIADEVGLGKTIEAGLIWTELRARVEANRLLVLCPKTLCDKWRTELDDRFGVDARIVDASELVELLSRSNGRGFAAVASMQSLRPPRGWNNGHDEDAETSPTHRKTLARLLDEAAEGQPLIDLLVIDEAHHMRNPETMLYSLGQLTNAASAHRVFLSATPIHLRNRDLHSLLRLIDPETFEYESTLDELILTNVPIVQARDMLMKPATPVLEVLNRLSDAGQYGILAGSKAIELIRDELSTKPLDISKRAELALRLEQVNQLANYVTRTRRRDVDEFRVRRDPIVPLLHMHAEEEEFYKAVTQEVTEYARSFDASERFLLSTPQRLLTSSPAAASTYWAASAVNGNDPIEETDEDLEEYQLDARPLVTRLAALARRLNVSERLEVVDSKYTLLLTQLRKLWAEYPGSKMIVFSSFKPTLNYLSRCLYRDGIESELLHGSVKESRTSILKRFRERPDRQVLLSSEVGSEGIDLQFCWVIVNYDLPWNPMRLEQRIGRVDRLGQESQKVVILNLIYEGTIDELIYQRLYKRLGIGERALGEFEAVLGEPIREMTLKLVDPTLTDEQKKDAIDKARQVAANLRQEEEKLEAEAGSLIKHGDYILEKIKEARDLNRWLHADDIFIYVRDRLQRSFRGCTIESVAPKTDDYRITLSPEARDELATFLARRGLRGTTRLLHGNEQQRYRFSSSVVRSREASIEVISQVHPLVRFAAELDRRDDLGNQAEPVAASVPRDKLKVDCDSGSYVVAVRRWVGNGADSRGTNTARLAYAGAELVTGKLLSWDLAEALALAAAEHGRPLYNFGADARLPRAAALLGDTVHPALDRRFDEFVQQITAEIEDRTAIRRHAVERHRDSKTANLLSQQERNKSRAAEFDLVGDQRKAKQLLSVNVAIEGKLRKLREACALRLAEIDRQREIIPEAEEVAAVLVELT
ncbi:MULTISPECIES: helicase-related protein [unclassified Bradyrhizobium]|uniref:helicase-related protein n=1 Tax=unclassified Bradyrhizobium TaxID=2631580 RepID=UPI00291658F6|nr:MULTISPECIES: helicase-related protein [unclassified Bradyrhizobium]